jgi:hypothetical protein
MDRIAIDAEAHARVVAHIAGERAVNATALPM